MYTPVLVVLCYLAGILSNGLISMGFLGLTLCFAAMRKYSVEFILFVCLIVIASLVGGLTTYVFDGAAKNLFSGGIYSLVALVAAREIIFTDHRQRQLIYILGTFLLLSNLVLNMLRFGLTVEGMDLYMDNGGRNLYSGVFLLSCLFLVALRYLDGKLEYPILIVIAVLIVSFVSLSRTAMILSGLFALVTVGLRGVNLRTIMLSIVITYLGVGLVDWDAVYINSLRAFDDGLASERTMIIEDFFENLDFNTLLGGVFHSKGVGLGINYHNSILQSIFIYGLFGIAFSTFFVLFFFKFIFSSMPIFLKILLSIIVARAMVDSLLILSLYDFFIYTFFFMAKTWDWKNIKGLEYAG